jgi:hypothetical protein
MLMAAARARRRSAVRSIKNNLVIGIRVDGIHQTTLNAKFIVQYLCKRSKAIGCAGCIRINLVLRLDILIVNTQYYGSINIAGRF